MKRQEVILCIAAALFLLAFAFALPWVGKWMCDYYEYVRTSPNLITGEPAK